MSNGFFMYGEAQQRFSFETYWCRISWSVALFKHFNVIEINEGSMFCSEKKKILVLFKSSRLCLCLTTQKKTRYYIHSTTHFGITSRIWISVFFKITELVFMVAELKQKWAAISLSQSQTGVNSVVIHTISLCVCASFSLSVSLLLPAQREQMTSFLFWHTISIHK